MPPTVSTITVAELRDAPGSFILLRADFPDLDKCYVWCGQYGWLPSSELANTLRYEYRSMRKAERAAQKYVTRPLQENPSCSHN
jgi:hypothetical protein